MGPIGHPDKYLHEYWVFLNSVDFKSIQKQFKRSPDHEVRHISDLTTEQQQISKHGKEEAQS